jgi:pyrroloquinoline quinone biosynthesis protein A
MPASPKMHSNVKTFKHVAGNRLVFNQTNKEMIMWTKPEVTEMRFGFEVTMYVCNR